MWIKTAEGWKRPEPQVIAPMGPPASPLGQYMNCYQLHGYASYEAWLNEKR